MEAINIMCMLSLAFASLLTADAQDEIKFCAKSSRGVSSGELYYQGTGDMCFCTIARDMIEKDTEGDVQFVIEMSLQHAGKAAGEDGCYPRLGVKTAVDYDAIHICPDEGVLKSTIFQLSNKDTLHIGLDNKDNTEYIMKAKYSTYPDVKMMVNCVISDQRAIMSNQNEAWGKAIQGDNENPGQEEADSGGSDAVAIGVGVAVAVVVIAAIIGVLFIVIKKFRTIRKSSDKELDDKPTEVANPGFNRDSSSNISAVAAPPHAQSYPPAQYGNVPVNPDPNPHYNNENPVVKQPSLGNLSTASTVSSVGVPDIGTGVIQTAGVQPQTMVSGEELQPANLPPQQAVHTTI